MTSPPTPVDQLLDESRLKQLNVVSLLAQAGRAQRNGDTERAALLFGAALIAPKYSTASYLIQGALTANDLRKKVQSG
ncbi:MAG: hypothetical protein ACOC0Z_05870 [Halohasta sp.]